MSYNWRHIRCDYVGYVPAVNNMLFEQVRTAEPIDLGQALNIPDGILDSAIETNEFSCLTSPHFTAQPTRIRERF